MAKANQLRGQLTSPKSLNEGNTSDIPSPEIASVLGKVEQLLNERRPEKAMEVIARSRLSSPWMTNAAGVCAMRLGNAKQASVVFQGLVAHRGVMLKPDAPLVFKINFATALLASNNLSGCLSVLHEIGADTNPAVKRLRAAVQQWKQSLSLWQKLKWYTGDCPQKPVVFDFPLGELA
jgi:hypothetical protein